MTPEEFKSARDTLGMSREQLGVAVGTKQDGHYMPRTVASWELGQRAVPPAVAKIVRLLLRNKAQQAGG